MQRTVTAIDADLTLRQFARRHWPILPNGAIKDLIDAGRVTLNRRAVRRGNIALALGDQIALEMGDCSRSIHHCALPDIQWENRDFLLLNKAPGLSSESIADCIAKRGWQLVHRLDRWTSGAFLVAKTASSKTIGEAFFRKRLVQKYYLAIVEGRVRWHQIRVLLPVFRTQASDRARLGVETAKSSNQGSNAHTQLVRLAVGPAHTLLLCRPTTGRTHQIRIHAAHLKHPVLGDRVYGNAMGKVMAPRQMLHANRLVISEIDLDCSISPPGDFLKILEREQLDGEY